MKGIIKLLKMMTAVFFIFLASPMTYETAFAAPSVEEIGIFSQTSESFDKMYDLWNTAVLNVYDTLEGEYAVFEKETDLAVTAKFKEFTAQGKNEAEAYALAYADQILVLSRLLTLKSLKNNNPLEGYYQLDSDQLAGYMSLYGDDKSIDVEFLVWKKANLAKIGICYALITELKDKTVTFEVVINDDTSEENSRDPKVQITIDFDGKKAKVKTSDEFRKGRFLTGGTQESFEKSSVILDGIYIRQEKN